jgi:protein SCO1/2
VVLDTPLARPDFTLTDTDGTPYDFRGETDGQLALLFFGYTNCPDICPVHMANLAAVLGRFDHDMRSRIALVFVTTDPARDSAVVLRAWLDRFDRSFVGLTGSPAVVDRIQTAMGMPPAARPALAWNGAPPPGGYARVQNHGGAGPSNAAGDYAVGHSSQILAFSPDGRAHVAYPAGIRQVDWAHDLPRLLEPEKYLVREDRR